MGITKKDCELLFYAKDQYEVSFEKTLTLGRLKMYVTAKEVKEYYDLYDQPKSSSFTKSKLESEYTEPLFKLLGAEQMDSLDFSDYEGATILHDLNQSISKQYHNGFSTIVDSGTIEHVFNFPIAIKNCMDCLEVGGHFIGISPANNQMGHGFYQFSPELYYRVFSPENGFEIQQMFIRAGENTYKVLDPQLVGSRVEIINSTPTFIIVIAKKVKSNVEFQIPQQSDYLQSWSVVDSIKTKTRRDEDSKIVHVYRFVMPKKLKIFLSNLRRLLTNEESDDKNLGRINPKHFELIAFSPSMD